MSNDYTRYFARKFPGDKENASIIYESINSIAESIREINEQIEKMDTGKSYKVEHFQANLKAYQIFHKKLYFPIECKFPSLKK